MCTKTIILILLEILKLSILSSTKSKVWRVFWLFYHKNAKCLRKCRIMFSNVPDLLYLTTLWCFEKAHTSLCIPYRISRARSLCRLDAHRRFFRFISFQSKRVPNDVSFHVFTPPIRAIELHHFPLTRSSPFYAFVRSTPCLSYELLRAGKQIFNP